jgi:hypothetical protein
LWKNRYKIYTKKVKKGKKMNYIVQVEASILETDIKSVVSKLSKVVEFKKDFRNNFSQISLNLDSDIIINSDNISIYREMFEEILNSPLYNFSLIPNVTSDSSDYSFEIIHNEDNISLFKRG